MTERTLNPTRRPWLTMGGKIHGQVESVRQEGDKYIATVRKYLNVSEVGLGRAYLTDEIETNQETFNAWHKWLETADLCKRDKW